MLVICWSKKRQNKMEKKNACGTALLTSLKCYFKNVDFFLGVGARPYLCPREMRVKTVVTGTYVHLFLSRQEKQVQAKKRFWANVQYSLFLPQDPGNPEIQGFPKKQKHAQRGPKYSNSPDIWTSILEVSFWGSFRICWSSRQKKVLI